MRILNLIAASALSIALATSAFAQATQPSPSNRSAPPPAASAPAQPSTAPATQGGLVDINSASKEQLDKLKGVGPARADAIVQNRPYKAKTDLKTRKIIPDSVYNDIQDKI